MNHPKPETGNLPLFEHNRLQHRRRVIVANVGTHGRNDLQEVFDRVDVLLGAELFVQLAGVLLLAGLLRRSGTDQIPQRLDRFRDQR